VLLIERKDDQYSSVEREGGGMPHPVKKTLGKENRTGSFVPALVIKRRENSRDPSGLKKNQALEKLSERKGSASRVQL